MITSATHRSWPGDHEIADLAKTGLPAPSMVRCAKIVTIEAPDAEPIGRLSRSDRQAVATLLQNLLAGMTA